ncbi:hypothetical protein RB595_009651 [Gaeumannomyces hyphopodioides]
MMNSWPGSSSSSSSGPSSSGSSSESLRKKRSFFRRLQSPFVFSQGDDDDLDDKELELRRRSRAFFPRPSIHGDHKAAVQHGSGEQPSQQPLQEPELHSRSQEAEAGTPTITTPAPTPASKSSRIEVIKGTPLHALNPRRGTASADMSSTSFVEETPPPADRAAAPASAAKLMLRRSTTAPLPATAAAAAARVRSVSTNSDSAAAAAAAATQLGRKRKRASARDGEEQRVPEERRIFRGLAFYYVPDNDIAPARRIRMSKAQKYGARRVPSPAEATHVIVDKGLEYKDIEPLVGPFLAPGTAHALIIVAETFPSDCLCFGILLNPFQDKYLIKGCPQTTVQPNSTRASPQEPPSGSQHSLQLKPAPSNKRSRKINSRSSTPPRQAPLVEASKEIIIPSSQEIPDYEDNTARFQHDEVQAAKIWSREKGPKDELSNYIEMMAQYRDLPLDDYEDDDVVSVRESGLATSDGEESKDDSESEYERSNKTRGGRGASKTGRKASTWEDGFACSHGGTGASKAAEAEANPNARTIEMLQSMCDFYERTNDHWRTTAYRKAIGTLRRTTDRRVATEEDAARLPGVGPRLARKIDEIATTDRLRRLEYARAEPLDAVLQTFLGVYGAGLAQAWRWIGQGFRSLDDLAARASLTPAQRMGVERHADLNSRIPRAEVEALAGLVRRAAALVDPAVRLLLGGSYRRGADTCGDVDFIVTKDGTAVTDDLVPFLDELLARLTEAGIVVATVAALQTDRPGGSKWHGCCVLPHDHPQAAAGGSRPVWRRVDFLLVPETEMGAALIYFTGNDIFNRSMRLLASKKGMRLNRRGLYRNVMRGPNRSKVTAGELVEGRDERRIFEILGVKWREPHERWC